MNAKGVLELVIVLSALAGWVAIEAVLWVVSHITIGWIW